MKLVLDIDGVLADFTSAYADRLVKITGENLLPKPLSLPCWDWDKFYGYTQQQIADTIGNIAKDRLFWRKLKPIPEPEVFARLNVLSKTHDLYFLTNRFGVECKQQTERFLYDHGINYPTVVIASDKLPILKAIKADFFVDDRLETMNQVIEARNNPKFGWNPSWTFLIDATYNQLGRDPRTYVANDVKDAMVKASLW